MLHEQFSYSERFYLCRRFLGCLIPIPFVDSISNVNYNRKRNHVTLKQQKKFDLVGYRVGLESIYNILKSNDLFKLDSCMIDEEEVFYYGTGNVLGINVHVRRNEKNLSLKELLTSNVSEIMAAQTGWKQVCYDHNVGELITAHVLDAMTTYYLRNLCKSVSTWHDYIGENRKELRIVEMKEELFKKKEANIDLLKECFKCINNEHLKLFWLISGSKENDIPQAFDFLINKGRLAEQYIKVLKQYWKCYLTITMWQNVDINIEIEKLKHLLFDSKLLKFLTINLRKNMVEQNIHKILQCCPEGEKQNFNLTTYAELEDFIRNKVGYNSSNVVTKLWETITLKDKEGIFEYKPEEFYLLKMNNAKLDISNDLYLAWCYRGIIKTDVKTDLKKAFLFFLKSAKSGEFTSMDLLGEYFYFGIGGVKKDYTQAFFYYKRFSERYRDGHTTYMVGECYYLGRGIKKNLNEALKYFKIAASSNFAPALIATIACYINNEGVQNENNFVMIHEYLWQASNIGLNVAILSNVVNEMENSSLNAFSIFKVVFGMNEFGSIDYRVIRK